MNLGLKWILLQEYSPKKYNTPRLVLENIPTDCKRPSTIFRWWQPFQPDDDTLAQEKPTTWLIDNVVVDQSSNPLNEIYDPLK